MCERVESQGVGVLPGESGVDLGSIWRRRLRAHASAGRPRRGSAIELTPPQLYIQGLPRAAVRRLRRLRRVPRALGGGAAVPAAALRPRFPRSVHRQVAPPGRDDLPDVPLRAGRRGLRSRALKRLVGGAVGGREPSRHAVRRIRACLRVMCLVRASSGRSLVRRQGQKLQHLGGSRKGTCGSETHICSEKRGQGVATVVGACRRRIGRVSVSVFGGGAAPGRGLADSGQNWSTSPKLGRIRIVFGRHAAAPSLRSWASLPTRMC